MVKEIDGYSTASSEINISQAKTHVGRGKYFLLDICLSS